MISGLTLLAEDNNNLAFMVMAHHRSAWYNHTDRPIVELALCIDPEWAYHYAKDVIKGRWFEGEQAIATNPKWTYLYAADVVRGRFELGEPAIMKAGLSELYKELIGEKVTLWTQTLSIEY